MQFSKQAKKHVMAVLGEIVEKFRPPYGTMQCMKIGVEVGANAEWVGKQLRKLNKQRRK